MAQRGCGRMKERMTMHRSMLLSTLAITCLSALSACAVDDLSSTELEYASGEGAGAVRPELDSSTSQTKVLAGTFVFPGSSVIGADGRCLDVHQFELEKNGGKVQTWDCNGAPQQWWYFDGNRIMTTSGRCLDVHAADAATDGGLVQIWQCNGSPQQRFRVEGDRIVTSAGKCLDIHRFELGANGGRVQVWQCNGSAQQRWTILAP
jgi:hypothetical protein